MSRQHHFGLAAAMSVVVANMVGTGVFTSLGFQLMTMSEPFPLIMLWVAGGVAAVCGALTYAELGAALPRSGGEYNFLSRIYHPGVGFIGGWVSATIGFAAPVALAAMTFGAYTRAAIGDGAPAWLDTALAAGLVIVLAAVHAGRRSASGSVQIMFTALKVGVILAFCLAALGFGGALQPISFVPQPGDAGVLTGGAFAISLIYVSYAYTGWNAATYLTGELERPQTQLPIVLVGGTIVVMLLYVALNATFLLVAPMDAMRGEVEVGYIAAEAVFGESGARLAGGVLAALLISTVSAMTIAGPRVLQVIGEDIQQFRWLAKTNEDGIPGRAVLFQSSLALAFILTGSFDFVLVFSGFTLAAISLITVLGVFVLRWRQPQLDRPFRVTAFPLPPLIYLALTAWTLWFVLMQRPVEGLMGLGLMGVGLLVYLITQRR